MIDWVAIKGALKPLVSDLMGLPPEQIRWQDEPEGTSWVNFPTVLLRVKSIVGNGTEEERREDQGDDDQTVNVCGQKHFTLSIRVESDTQDISDPNQAGAFGETLKTRLARTSSVERLTPIMGIADFLSTTWFDYVDKAGRQISTYVMDLLCLTVDNDPDTTDGAGSFINEAEIDGTLTDDAGINHAISLDVKGE